MSISNLETSPAPAEYQRLFQKNPTLAEFKRFLVAHRVFAWCEQTILAKIARPGAFNILSVIGPSGAGKTQLMTEVAGVLLGIKDSNPDADEGAVPRRAYLPVVCVTAHTGRSFESRFRNLLTQILGQVNGVLTDLGKASPDARAIYSRTYGPTSQTISSLSIAKLEELVRVGLKERRVRALLIDEAQHLAQSASATDWRLVADGLKLLGSISGTLVVMFGTSELLGLPHISGQLGRRSKSIHMRRYLWSDAADQKEFKKILAAFSKQWPVLLPPGVLTPRLQLIYAGCVGCVGTLYNWLYDAIATAEREGTPSVTWDILQRSALSVPRLRKLHQEAQECEESFAAERTDLDQLASELCVGGNIQQMPVLQTEKDSAAPPSLAKPRKPGERNPTYDKYRPHQPAQP